MSPGAVPIGSGGESALYWSRYRPRNFGDWLTPFLFRRLTGRAAVHAAPGRLGPGETTVFGAGSILRHLQTPDVAVIWGSGIIAAGDRFARPLRTLLVRGPLTRQRFAELGHDCPEAYGDPGLILPRVHPAAPDKRHALGLIPHFAELEGFRVRPLPADWTLIDVTRPVAEVADAIAACERTVSSSLHGIVVSQAYGVPCAWIAAGVALHGDGTKFRDHYAALGLSAPRPAAWSAVTPAGLCALDFLAPDVAALQAAILASCPFLPARAAVP